MFNKVVLPLLIVLAGSAAVAGLVLAKPTPQAMAAPPPAGNTKVSVYEAKKEVVQLSVSVQGTVKPKNEIDIVAEVSGLIVKVGPAFVEGGYFSSDEIVLQIDDTDYQLALAKAQSSLADAQRSLAEEHGLSRQAKREWRDLGNQAANELFVRKPQLASAKAKVAAAQAEVKLAELNLERTKVRLPFDGRVKSVQANRGQYVSKGTPLASVYDSSALEVRLALTEQEAALINMPFSAEHEDPPGVDVVGEVAGEMQSWQGFLTRTAAYVDEKSRMYFVTVDIPKPFLNTTAPLLPGMFVNAVIEGKEIPGVFRLPRKALYTRDQVVTVDQESKTFSHTVQVLRKTANDVWVRGALPDNTMVILEQQSLVPQGTTVDPVLRNEVKELDGLASNKTNSAPVISRQ